MQKTGYNIQQYFISEMTEAFYEFDKVGYIGSKTIWDSVTKSEGRGRPIWDQIPDFPISLFVCILP